MASGINKNQWVLIGVIALAILLSGTFFFNGRKIKKDLHKEKVNSEVLLSEKLSLEKSIEKFRKDLESVKGDNAELRNLLAKTSADLEAKDKEVKALRARATSSKELNSKLKELENMKAGFEKELALIKSENQSLKEENVRLKKQLEETVADKEILQINNSILRSLAANSYRIDAVRGKKDKLTVRARCTQRLVVSFDLPKEAGDEFSFVLKTPSGEEISSKTEGTARINFIPGSERTVSSKIEKDSNPITMRRAEMIYNREEKLQKGIYEFKLYDQKERFIGSTQIRLR